MTRFGSLLALACLVAPPVSAQSWGPSTKPVWPDEGPLTWGSRPTSPEISANDLRTRLYQFAHDSMQGRRAGEPGNLKGTEYIAAEFQRLGLKQAGDNGTYFQELPFGPIGFDAAASRLAVGRAALRPRNDWIPIIPRNANGLSGLASLANAPTVFAGRWGEAAPLDPAVFRGKVAVFVSAPTAPGAFFPAPQPVVSCDALPDRFGAAAVTINPRPANLAAPRNLDTRARDAGAAAVLIIGLDEISAANAADAFSADASMQPAPAASKMAGATISRSAATRIFGKPIEQLTFGQTGSAVSATWNYAWRPAAAPARNVIAILPGSDPARAGEYVLVGAHNDHEGVNAVGVDHDSLRAVNTVTRRQGANDPVCIPTAAQRQRIDSLIARARSIRPARRDSIMNGADDDGSGTVVMLEIAERFASERPARSILFISHQGEEAGLLGSRWFVDHPTVPLASIVAAHNMDMVGKGRVEQVKFGGPASVQSLGSRRLSREFGDIIDSVNAVSAEPMAIDKTWDVTANPMNRFCRSDQVNYVRKDVPVTYFSLGYAQDYHQVTDEAQYIDYEHSASLGRFLHDVMWAISERTNRPAIAGPDPAYPRC
ncbi:MAG: M28 family peptidase [Gemmatimonadetes bacterium]|nr:M28 family peptidase [Gemmatimonadota bacterium]